MNSFVFNILLASLAILRLSNHVHAANVPLAELQQSPQHGHSFRDIQIIRDIKAYIQQNPHLRLIRLNKKAPHNHHAQSVKYTLGNRVAGDRMVAQYADTIYYPTLRDVSIQVTHPKPIKGTSSSDAYTQVTYPETGSGSVITFVDIHCLQDNADGNAYVVAGGVGERFISIVLEATQTKRFSYNIHYFGSG